MVSLINKQLLLTAYAYLFITEQQKAQQGSEALQVRTTVPPASTTSLWQPDIVFAGSQSFRYFVELEDFKLHSRLAGQGQTGGKDKSLLARHYNNWLVRTAVEKIFRQEQSPNYRETALAAARKTLLENVVATPTEDHGHSAADMNGLRFDMYQKSWKDGSRPANWPTHEEKLESMRGARQKALLQQAFGEYVTVFAGQNGEFAEDLLPVQNALVAAAEKSNAKDALAAAKANIFPKKNNKGVVPEDEKTRIQGLLTDAFNLLTGDAKTGCLGTLKAAVEGAVSKQTKASGASMQQQAASKQTNTSGKKNAEAEQRALHEIRKILKEDGKLNEKLGYVITMDDKAKATCKRRCHEIGLESEEDIKMLIEKATVEAEMFGGFRQIAAEHYTVFLEQHRQHHVGAGEIIDDALALTKNFMKFKFALRTLFLQRWQDAEDFSARQKVIDEMADDTAIQAAQAKEAAVEEAAAAKAKNGGYADGGGGCFAPRGQILSPEDNN